MTDIEYKQYITLGDIHNNQDSVFVYEDTDTREGKFKGLRNTVGIRVKKSSGHSPSAYYTDDEYVLNCKKIREDLENLFNKSNKQGIKRIVFPSEGIGTGPSMLITIANDTYKWLTYALKEGFGITNGSKRNFDYINKMTEDLSRQPTGKFNPKYGFNSFSKADTDRRKEYKTISIGDGIVFSAMGGQILKGYVIDINNKNTPDETYKVKLTDDSSAAIKSRHTLASISGTIMDIVNRNGTEMYKVKLTDGTIRAIRHNDINYKSNSGPVAVGDKVGFESSDIKIMIVSPSTVKSKIAIIPDEYHTYNNDVINIDRKKSKMHKTKAKLIHKPIRKPIKKFIKKSPTKKCKCKK